MNVVLRLLIVIGIFIVFLGFGFSVYAQFLLDYSLENLEFSISNSHSQIDTASAHQRAVYKSLLEDLAIEEVGQEDIDIEQLALLELANRSYEEGDERGGYKRSKIYLNQAYESKQKDRTPLLQFLDHIYSYWDSAFDSMKSVYTYLKKRFSPKEKELVSTDYSSQFLLNRARALEKDFKFEDAAVLYREYLGLRPKRKDYGYVQISLAQILMKMGRLKEAETTLSNLFFDAKDSEEGQVAKQLLNKIKVLKSRKSIVNQLESALKLSPNREEAEAIRLRLATAYLSLYEFDRSSELFKRLLRSRSSRIRSKAKFYLGWLYKLTYQHKKGEMALLSLVQERQLTEDLEIGLRAQLADIYYQAHDVEKSLEQYRKISALAAQGYIEANQEIIQTEAKRKSWLAFSEIEQANIFYYDLKKPEEGDKRLAAAGKLYGEEFLTDVEELKESLSSSDWKLIRKRAFQALEAKQLGRAYELFHKNLRYQPKDSWTYAGMSTVLALFGEMDEALDWAKKGWEFRADEYTSAVMGYMYGLWNQYPESVAMYDRASEFSPNYIPARFNRACTLLRIKRYQEALEAFEGMSTEILNLNDYIKSKVYNNMGFAKWYLGDPSGAEDAFREALSIRPEFQVAKKNLDQIQKGIRPDIASLKGRG